MKRPDDLRGLAVWYGFLTVLFVASYVIGYAATILIFGK